MSQLFPLGQVVATPGALSLEIDLRPFIARHQSGDWGELCPEDQRANTQALDQGAQILSSYPTPHGVVWIITEGDRSSTCVLLPEEY